MMQDPSTYFNNQFPEHEILKCPRCDSSNTKFCYYNNYNLSQPRHYCKNCKRYWTKGGTLRNIPVGGASRKITKRSSTSNNPKRPPPPPTTTTTTDKAHVTSSDPTDPVSNNISKNQQQQQTFVGASTYSSASYLLDSLYPRMGMGVFDGQLRVDPKVEDMSGKTFDWPDLAIFTPGGSAFQ